MKIIDFFGKLFGTICKVTFWLVLKIANVKRWEVYKNYSGLLFIILLFVCGWCAYTECPLWVITSILVVMFAILYIKDIEKTILTISGFLSLGIQYWILFTGFAVCFMIKQINEYPIMLVVVSGITWCIFCLHANNKVARVSNEILSTVFGLIVIMKDVIISSLSVYYLEKNMDPEYPSEQLIELTYNIAFSPILAINLLSLLLCTLKGYWIEKYNDNKDIDESWFEEKESVKEENLI